VGARLLGQRRGRLALGLRLLGRRLPAAGALRGHAPGVAGPRADDAAGRRLLDLGAGPLDDAGRPLDVAAGLLGRPAPGLGVLPAALLLDAGRLPVRRRLLGPLPADARAALR